MPTFFIIGAAKCGTTSLSYYLDLHPEIHMSPVKEPRFFAESDAARPFAERRVSSLDEYVSLFRTDLTVRGEASPSYSQHPWRRGVPARIRAMVPEAKFLYLVGDPLRRITAHHSQAVAHSGEDRPIEEVLGELRELEHPYVCPGLYATQVACYHKVFPPERLLVVDQDALLKDRWQTLRQVFHFLDVDPSYSDPAFDTVRNATGRHRRVSSGVYGRLRHSQLGQAVRLLPAPVRRQVVAPARRVLARKVDRLDLNPYLCQRLAEIYRPEVERLREITGQRFAGWSI